MTVALKSMIFSLLSFILLVYILKQVRSYKIKVHKGVVMTIEKKAWVGGYNIQLGTDQVDSVILNEVIAF